MSGHILLCTDLDRTLLPNGLQPESPRARLLFASLVRRPEICLAYVTGRHLALTEAAMQEYALPVPDFILSDVGTCLYHREADGWTLMPAWQQHIDADWHPCARTDLQAALAPVAGLRLQEADKQNTHKLSFYAPADSDHQPLLMQARAILDALGVKASLVWSIDETSHTGLLDVLPASATKLGAIRYLMQHTGHAIGDTVFAGDSGNDLPVLCSDIPSVLVANATVVVQAEARRLADIAGHSRALYQARGRFTGHNGKLDLNGNYSAGILEGVVHYHPEVGDWLQ